MIYLPQLQGVEAGSHVINAVTAQEEVDCGSMHNKNAMFTPAIEAQGTGENYEPPEIHSVPLPASFADVVKLLLPVNYCSTTRQKVYRLKTARIIADIIQIVDDLIN